AQHPARGPPPLQGRVKRVGVYAARPPRPPPSFPTRRSSDLILERIAEIVYDDPREACRERPGERHDKGQIEQRTRDPRTDARRRSEEHTSELQSRSDIVCRLPLEKKNNSLMSDAVTVQTFSM